MSHAGVPRSLNTPNSSATPLYRPSDATVPTFLWRYSTGGSLCSSSARLSARRVASRIACWAFGGQNLPGLSTSGTAAQSPAAQAFGTTLPSASATWSVGSTITRPSLSTGRSDASLMTGLALTPAVHTIVSESNSTPVDVTTWPSTHDDRNVLRWNSMPRFFSSSSAYSAM